MASSSCGWIQELNGPLLITLKEIRGSLTPLICSPSSTGSFPAMHRLWFMSRCNEGWSAHGFGSMNGHSFRIGSTTHLLLLGVDPFIVMVQDQWKSTAF